MLIKGNRINNTRIKAMLVEGEEYNIYRAFNDATVLLVAQTLYSKWTKEGLLFNVNPFEKIEIDDNDFYFLKSHKDFILDMASFGHPLCNRHAAVTFAFVLNQIRKSTDVSLFDGIYIEEFGYILPTYTEEKVSDDALIGTYLTGGQLKHFSEDKIDAMHLRETDLEEVAKLVGIERINGISTNGENKRNPALRNRFMLVGRPELEKFFNEHIVAILNEPERYKKLGIDFPSSIILYGPPGCGKTYAVDRLVDFLDLPKFEINSSTVASSLIHDTAKKVAEVFNEAISRAPSVMIIDEMESYLSSRNKVTEVGTHHIEEVAEFLRQIQKAQENKVLILAMTNMLNAIDPAILRRGRFDHHIEVGLPSKAEITSLIKAKLKKVAMADDIKVEELVTQLEGKTFADVAFVIKEAALISGKNGLDRVTHASLQEAVDALPKEQMKRRIGFFSAEEEK